MHTQLATSYFLARLNMDFVIELSHASRKHNSILVVVDRFSEMAHFVAFNKTIDPWCVMNLFMKESAIAWSIKDYSPR